MYQSRLHAANGVIALDFDALSGELLALVREDTADNALKNHVRRTGSLLDGMLHTAEGDKRFFLPRYADIKAHPALKPDIRMAQADGETVVTLHYSALAAQGEPVALSAEIVIRLLPDDCRARFRLTLHNHTGFDVDDVAFPAVDGLWLGERWQDDTLVYPHFAGCRIDNPTEQLTSPPQTIHWKWQEYIYRYHIGQETGTPDDRGAYVRRLNYSGEASMLWMDLFAPTEHTGIAIACHDERLTMKSLRFESFGAQDPGCGLAILHRPALSDGQSWCSGECVLAFHEGDWHWAADDYRAWFSSLPRRTAPPRPAWFLQSPGLMAHYDFQYQGGGIVHRFADIPALMAQALDMGIPHLLLAGWHEDGFDFGFPHYAPNSKLGTPEELAAAVAACKQMGGHVCFYINSRLCNTAFEDLRQRVQESAVMQRDGSLRIERYGADDLSFASMCIGDPAWRRQLGQAVHMLTHDIGADGVYLDQFAMATSLPCYHPNHAEHAGNPCAWNQGYERLLSELEQDAANANMLLLYEGCNDIFGPYAGGQLISELHCPFGGRMPEVYKYTFPDQILVDMMNPRRRSAMRPEHVARHSTELLHNAFTMGAYFWCYDLEGENEWRSDPVQRTRLVRLLALRSAWLTRYGQGRFTDTVGLSDYPQDALIKRYALEDGVLLACAKEGGLHGTVCVQWPQVDAPVCHILTATVPTPQAHPCALRTIGGTPCVEIALPDDEAAVIVLRTA